MCTGPQKEPRGKARTHQPITVPTIHAPSGCHGFPCGRAEAHRSGAKGAFLLVQNVPVSWRTLVCRQITHETYFFCCEDCLLRPDGGLHLENVKSHEQTRPHHCLLKAKKHRTSSYGAPEWGQSADWVGRGLIRVRPSEHRSVWGEFSNCEQSTKCFQCCQALIHLSRQCLLSFPTKCRRGKLLVGSSALNGYNSESSQFWTTNSALENGRTGDPPAWKPVSKSSGFYVGQRATPIKQFQYLKGILNKKHYISFSRYTNTYNFHAIFNTCQIKLRISHQLRLKNVQFDGKNITLF